MLVLCVHDQSSLKNNATALRVRTDAITYGFAFLSGASRPRLCELSGKHNVNILLCGFLNSLLHENANIGIHLVSWSVVVPCAFADLFALVLAHALALLCHSIAAHPNCTLLFMLLPAVRCGHVAWVPQYCTCGRCCDSSSASRLELHK